MNGPATSPATGTSPPAALAEDLPARLAARGIATEPAVFTAAQREELGAVAPARVTTPATLDALRDVVVEAAVSGSPLLLVGGGTALGAGGPLARADLAVATKALNRIVEHSPADFVVTVEAGCRLADLQEALARDRQWLAVEPPDPARATIGGMVAAAATSLVAAAHGTVKNHLLGVRALYADGRFGKAGGRVVKNVAGYDLMKMHHGAFGTLGAVATATFRLRPLPASDLLATAPAPDAGAIVAFADALARPGLLPAGVHLVGTLRAGGIEGELLARFQGARAACEGQLAAVERVTAPRIGAMSRADVGRDAAGRPAALRALGDVFARGDDAGVGHVSLHFAPSRLADLLAALGRFGAGRVALDLQRGTGSLKLPAGSSTSLAESLAHGLRELAAALAGSGAAAYVQAGPPILRASLPAHATTGVRARLHACLKAELDPNAIFSRGRLAEPAEVAK